MKKLSGYWIMGSHHLFKNVRNCINHKLKKLIYIFMEPEQNRNEPPSENYPQYSPEMYPRPYTPFPPLHNGTQYNYMFSPFNSIYYPYNYQTNPYPNGSYAPQPYPSWRDTGTYSHYSGPLPNYHFPPHHMQNARAIHRETKEKRAPEIINLESDDEGDKPHEDAEGMKGIERKQVQKPPLVIQIEDNTPQKQEKKAKALNAKSKADTPKVLKKIKKIEGGKQQIKDARDQQIKEEQLKDNAKITKEERKDSLIGKKPLTPEEIEIRLMEKMRKEEKRKEREKKKIQTSKIEKHQAERKKTTKLQEFEYFIPKGKKDKKQQKQELEIAKYMESHGEIRQGWEFQCSVPALSQTYITEKDYKEWMEDKRRRILMQEVNIHSF